MKSVFRRFVARLFENQVRRLIARHKPRVVAVGGSVGKTGTRLAIATVLREKFRTQSIIELGYNSEIGLPLSVFAMSVPGSLFNPFAWAWKLLRSEFIILSRYRPQVLVLELGTDHPGEIPRYLRYLSPDISVITALTAEHMENFPGGMDQLAAEELALAGGSKVFVANYDEIPAKYRHKYLDPHPNHHYYGLGSEPEYGLTVAATDPENGTTATLSHEGHTTLKHLSLPLFGQHSAKAAAAAYAVADLMGLTTAQIAAGLAGLKPVSGRMNPLAGINGSMLIDDTYNSSPEAAIAALRALEAAPASGRRIAIMGSMNELGPDAPRYHEQVGEAAAGVDLLVTIGALASKHLGPAAVRAGLDPSRFKPADSPYAAGAFLAALLAPGDVVLSKGSQNGVFAEEALKPLLRDPADISKFVRQSRGWLRTKAAQFPDFKGEV